MSGAVLQHTVPPARWTAFWGALRRCSAPEGQMPDAAPPLAFGIGVVGDTATLARNAGIGDEGAVGAGYYDYEFWVLPTVSVRCRDGLLVDDPDGKVTLIVRAEGGRAARPGPRAPEAVWRAFASRFHEAQPGA